MDSRERLLNVLNNEKPDRLPCQVHSWMDYYLKTYLEGMDQYQAYMYFDMDAVIYQAPEYIFNETDNAKWSVNVLDMGIDSDGSRLWINEITTPGGKLTTTLASIQYTEWTTEYLIKTEKDFELWNKYIPRPVEVDYGPARQAKNKIGSKGIVRGGYHGVGQGSPWQDLCFMFGTQEAIMAAIDKPDWIHYTLQCILEKNIRIVEVSGKCETDVVEIGGGAASSTVISPAMFEEFCLPYDCELVSAIHNAGGKVVYHLCGGIMPLLYLVVETGTDGLETMTPPSMGGDCDLAQASRQVGDKLFFIGGFDQNAGFEHGTPAVAQNLVHKCHQSCLNGGYICSPSDHFFFGDPKNVQAFVDAAKECTYN